MYTDWHFTDHPILQIGVSELLVMQCNYKFRRKSVLLLFIGISLQKVKKTDICRCYKKMNNYTCILMYIFQISLRVRFMNSLPGSILLFASMRDASSSGHWVCLLRLRKEQSEQSLLTEHCQERHMVQTPVCDIHHTYIQLYNWENIQI